MIKSVTLIAVVTLTLLVLASRAASADPGEVLITSNYPVTLVYEGLPQRIPLKAADATAITAANASSRNATFLLMSSPFTSSPRDP